jgi:hypothetical protein
MTDFTKRFTGAIRAVAVITGLLLTAGGASALAGGTASAATFAQNGDYQFAASSASVSASNEFSNAPLGYPDASQTLGANGVDLSAGAGADSGIVVPLGRLHDLFNKDGQFVAPAIVGSGLEGYNLYVDTSASDTFLGFPGGSAVFLDHGASDTPAYDGTNKLAMGAVNNTNAAAVGVDCTWTGQNATVIPAGTCAITMAQVKADFATNPDGDTNPLVWAWIGVGDTSATQTGYVTSVDGTNLVSTVTPPPACTGITGNHQASTTAPAGLTASADATTPSREDLSWKMPCDVAGAAWSTSIFKNGVLMDTKVVTTNAVFYGALVKGAVYTVTVRWNDPGSPKASITFTAA